MGYTGVIGSIGNKYVSKNDPKHANKEDNVANGYDDNGPVNSLESGTSYADWPDAAKNSNYVAEKRSNNFPTAPKISSNPEGYNPTAAKAQWQNDLEDFVGNQISKWADNVKNTYVPEKVTESVSDAFSPLGEVISDNIPVVSQLEQAKEHKAERKEFEDRTGDYEYLNSLVDEDEGDPSYNGLTYGDAISQIAQKLVDDPKTTLSDREKDIIKNRSEGWQGDWSLPYIAASDAAYRKSYNDRAEQELGEEAALLKPQTFDFNFGPISIGAQDDNAMDSNTNYGFYIDPNDATQLLGEYNYQPYSSTDDNDWDYAFGTDGGWGKNYVGETANNLNNFFNTIGEARQNWAKDTAENSGKTITLSDGNTISLDDMKNNYSLTGTFYDPNQVTEDQLAELKASGAQPIGDRDTSGMTPKYYLIIGADGSILPGDFNFDTAEVSPDGQTFTVSNGSPFDGTYNVRDWMADSITPVTASAQDLDLSDEDAQALAGSVPVFYWTAVADPTDENSVRNNAQDVTLPDGQVITAEDFLNYQNGSNVDQNDTGWFNALKQNVETPWSGDLNTFAENIVPWFIDTGLQSWQTMVPGLSRFLGPLWAGGRAVAEMQGLDPNRHIRGDLDTGGGYTKNQQALRAIGDLADPAIEHLSGIGGQNSPIGKALNKALEYRPAAKFVADTAGEGAEEALTGFIQQLGQNPTSDPWEAITSQDTYRNKVYNPITNQYELNQNEDVNDNIYSLLGDNFIGGALFSAPINAARHGIDYAMNKDTYKEKKDTPFRPRRTKASKSVDYNLDDNWKSYYDQYLEDMEG